jgi:glycosyltransferase involved in cell wall biosynthesis
VLSLERPAIYKDQNMPTVSVVIPTFNRSKLVLRAINSVLTQTYKDYEIIVVDDGSTDDTPAALKPHMGQIRYVYQENRGVSAAQNKGVQLATGKWISILDSDDVWLPTKLELQFQAIGALGKDFGACFTNCDFFGETGVVPSAFEQAGLRSELVFGPLQDPIKVALARYPAICVQSLLVSRSLIEQLHGFDEDVVVGEDVDLIFRLTFKTKFCFVNQAVVRIDRTPSRGGNLMELLTQNDDRAFRSQELLFKKWICWPENIDPAIRQSIRYKLKLLYYDWLVAKLYRFRYAEALEIARRIRAAGDSNGKIYNTLVFRTKGKISSLITQFRKGLQTHSSFVA